LGCDLLSSEGEKASGCISQSSLYVLAGKPISIIEEKYLTLSLPANFRGA
jgi:hypothetical protein